MVGSVQRRRHTAEEHDRRQKEVDNNVFQVLIQYMKDSPLWVSSLGICFFSPLQNERRHCHSLWQLVLQDIGILLQLFQCALNTLNFNVLGNSQCQTAVCGKILICSVWRSHSKTSFNKCNNKVSVYDMIEVSYSSNCQTWNQLLTCSIWFKILSITQMSTLVFVYNGV